MSGDRTRRSVPGSGTARGDSESYVVGKNEKELTLYIPDLELIATTYRLHYHIKQNKRYNLDNKSRNL